MSTKKAPMEVAVVAENERRVVVEVATFDGQLKECRTAVEPLWRS